MNVGAIELQQQAPRIGVVDADRRIQQSLSEVLRVAGMQVVGTAGDVRSALEMLDADQPSVLLIDPRLPDLEAGSALLASVRRGWPGVRIVLMGWPDTPTTLPQAAAFVSKSDEPAEFVAAIAASAS